MAENQEDQEQKTEQPTQRRIEEAVKRGQIPFSREVTHLFALFMLALVMAMYMPSMLHNTRELLTPLLANAEDFRAEDAASAGLLSHLMKQSLGLLVVPFLAVIFATFAASFVQNGFIWSTDPLMPKLEKISPLAGFKRIFSMRSFVEFLKGIFKILIVGFVCYAAVAEHLAHMRQLHEEDMIGMLSFILMLIIKVMIGVCLAMFFIAIADVLYQRFAYFKNLRMSKQELKEEYKQQEGDPQIKQKLRQLRAERAKNRMMQAVPSADVVITNPTHYAIALKYDSKNMNAPEVIAAGLDLVALTIRRIAEENNVPIVENPPLARALYETTKIGEEVPVQHYQAVAEIISYVFKLKGKKK